MHKRLPVVALAVAATTLTTTAPAFADSKADAKGTIVDVVIAASGESGLDDKGGDYDILREALVATGLAEAVATTDDITVFAPNDRAFLRLAHDLGYEGGSEEGALTAVVEATGFVSADEPGLLDDVLLYHVAPEARTIKQLRRAGEIETLLPDGTLRVRDSRVRDADTNDRNASATGTIRADNGIIVTVDRVLRPVDLP